MLLNDIDLNSLARLRSKLALVDDDDKAIGALSHSEQIAIALILNRPDAIEGHDTILGAIDRLGIEDLQAAIQLHRERTRGRW